ncbi:MAG: alpha/beta hydrolase [Deltaproteobacteria bacterium]|nr:alpha/beta hydrolase [Deltaproteobacteria bacterium]MDX9761824.1 alpha/beta hydrolase [Desulfomonilia bacterium]HPW69924.1 alpha/beta hydrolase [Deltaproteobacteria bacterium]
MSDIAYKQVMIIREENCFYPDHVVYSDPSHHGFAKEELMIQERLHSWIIQPRAAIVPPATIVHLHGNAENMTSHVTAALFLPEMGHRLVTFDYSGYGRSRGEPSLRQIQDDARAVFHHILAHPEAFGAAVFGFGQSMGAYTLARVLPDFPSLKGAILEAGLHSFHALFSEAYPQIRCEVPEAGFSALDTLPVSPVPKLFIHGTDDPVVPHTHSIRMHEVAREPKELVILDGVGHIDAFVSRHARQYMLGIHSFIEKHRG